MKVHRSLRVEEELWKRAEERADVEGFTSTNQYLVHLLRSDIEQQMGLEQMEASIVSSISKIAARVTSLGTMNQALFAVVWGLVEEFMRTTPNMGAYSRDAERRIEQFRNKVAGEVRGHSFWKGMNHDEAATAVQTGS